MARPVAPGLLRKAMSGAGADDLLHAGELAGGDTDVGQHVTRALAQGPPLKFDARLAQVELAAARGDPATPRLAEGAGYLVDVPRLRSLAAPHTISPGLHAGHP